MCALLAGGSTPLASAAPTAQEDYNDVVKRLEEARRKVRDAQKMEKGIRGSISEREALRRTAETELEELQALVDQAASRVNEAETTLGSISDQLNQKSTELEAQLAATQQARAELKARARAIYLNGPVTILEYIFSAESLSEVMSRVSFMSNVVDQDQNTIEFLEDASKRIESERTQIAKMRDDVAQQVATVASERNAAASLRNNVAGRRNVITGEISSLGGQLKATQAEKNKWLAQQRELEAESSRIRTLLKGRTEGTASAKRGEMLRPVAGPITSAYGYRTHPIYGDRRFHSGVDIGAASGTSVKAAAGGVVIFAGTKGGYGTTVIIDHGGGLATLYAHMSAISAGNGSSVAPGDSVGRVGCSGACTGPHLHFEVRVNGEPQNPMAWIG